MGVLGVLLSYVMGLPLASADRKSEGLGHGGLGHEGLRFVVVIVIVIAVAFA
jgi:hypothetical protein